ncbi:uncharacterized protein [Zea mays]|uniref:uncharacterized protein n=1 Tax=Zea mays TaxID=4577 RepID=UPI001652B046|nr:uncharacterized protein LOC118472292 [Zea mays]
MDKKLSEHFSAYDEYRNFNNWLSVMNFISRLLFKGLLGFMLIALIWEFDFFVVHDPGTISTSRQLEAKRDLVAGVVYGTDFFTFKEIQFQKLQRLLDGCHPDFDNDHLCSVNNHDLLLEMSTPSADLHLLPEIGVENIRTPKSLHAELKRELSKLNTVLKLPDNVLFLANQFIEYLLHNHLVVREPRSILHAFNIALCWRAASFLKYTELDHRESVALASDGLNYECNEAPS